MRSRWWRFSSSSSRGEDGRRSNNVIVCRLRRSGYRSVSPPDSFRRCFVDIAIWGPRGWKSHRLTGFLITLFTITLVIIDRFPSGRRATDGRQILVTVHHEALFRRAAAAAVHRRRQMVGRRRVRFVRIVFEIVLESRVYRHLTAHYHLGVVHEIAGFEVLVVDAERGSRGRPRLSRAPSVVAL